MEAKMAAKALLFFCDDMEPKEQWEKAVDILREMHHMQKANVWNLMTSSELSSTVLSKRRTAYKRALREAEEGGVCTDNGNAKKISELEDENMELLEKLKWWMHDSTESSTIKERNTTMLSGDESTQFPDLSAFLTEQRGVLAEMRDWVKAERGGDDAKHQMERVMIKVDNTFTPVGQSLERLTERVMEKGDTAKHTEEILLKLTPVSESIAALGARLEGMAEQNEKMETTVAKIYDAYLPVQELITELTVSMSTLVTEENKRSSEEEEKKLMSKIVSAVNSGMGLAMEEVESSVKHLVELETVQTAVTAAMKEVIREGPHLAAEFDTGPIMEQIKLINAAVEVQKAEIKDLETTTVASIGVIKAEAFTQKLAIQSLASKEYLETTVESAVQSAMAAHPTPAAEFDPQPLRDEIDAKIASTTVDIGQIKASIAEQNTAMGLLASKEEIQSKVDMVTNSFSRNIATGIEHSIEQSLLAVEASHASMTEVSTQNIQSIEELRKSLVGMQEGVSNQNTAIETLKSSVDESIAAAEKRIEDDTSVKIKGVDKKVSDLISSQDVYNQGAFKRNAEEAAALIKEQDTKMKEGDANLQAQINDLKEQPAKPGGDGAAGGEPSKGSVDSANPGYVPPEGRAKVDSGPHKQIQKKTVKPAGRSGPTAGMQSSMEESFPDPRSDSPTKRIHLRAEQDIEDPSSDPTASGFQRPTTMLAYLSRQFGP